MKKLILLLIVSFTFNLLCFSQSSRELLYQNGVWQNGYKLSAENVKMLLVDHPEALSYYKNGRALNTVSYIIVIPSAFLFGYDIGGRIAGADGNTPMLIGSGIGVVAGILLNVAGVNKIKSSLTLYNSTLQNKDVSWLVNFGFTQSGGIGLTVEF